MHFPSPALLTEDGNTVRENLEPGREYLLTLKGEFDGATVELQTYNSALSEFTAVEDGSWTAAAEIRFVSPDTKLQLVVSIAGASTAIGATLTPLL
jgi:hypothetical protein